MSKFIIVAVLAITMTFVLADEAKKEKFKKMKEMMCSDKSKAVEFCTCLGTNGGMSCDNPDCTGMVDTFCDEATTKDQFKEIKGKCFGKEKSEIKGAVDKCKPEGMQGEAGDVAAE